jgi:aryl-phospho-beta-D-glucosidase BglC (GH1 family)
MEYTAIGGWSPNDPFPQLVESNWAALHAWGVNTIRVPLNEASYLGLMCVNASKQTQNADPGNNYKTRLKQVVNRATSEGLYVILDLHWTAPDDPLNAVNGVSAQCAAGQNPVPDISHSIAFWTDVATNYRSYPNVLFELFNEPFNDQWYNFFNASSETTFQILRDGAQIDSYVPAYNPGIGHEWQSAGLQSLTDAIRATGADNVILGSGINWTKNLSLWLKYKVNDPLHQLAAVWHAYPTYGSAWGSECYTHPDPCDDRDYNYADAILAANYPVIVTEFGDRNTTGTVGAPFASTLLPKLDARGISYLGWTFTAAQDTDNVLLKDNNGTPTDGYGVYVKAHYLCRAAGNTTCQ